MIYLELDHSWFDIEESASMIFRWNATDENLECPEHWGGFEFTPHRIEFWQAHPYRLHRREVFQKNKNGEWVEPRDVIRDGEKLVDVNKIEVKTGKIEKMSKSKKNVVDPNDIINLYGADTARWFMLSDSPPERDLQWTDTGITASFKFLNRLYDLINKFKDLKTNQVGRFEKKEELKTLVNGVTENIESFQFNKSVAKIYEYVNILNECLLMNKISKKDLKWSLEKLSIILQPFVPHISEEIWSSLGNSGLCIDERWPKEDVQKNTDFNIAIQVNGKTKEVIKVDQNLKKEEILKIDKNNKKINKFLLAKNVVREIYVPGKIINLVIK